MTYRVFKRKPWKRNPAYPSGWEPNGGARKQTIERGLSLDEARRTCARGNEGQERGTPGLTWYEFEQE